jgi:hypothetical protein
MLEDLSEGYEELKRAAAGMSYVDIFQTVYIVCTVKAA